MCLAIPAKVLKINNNIAKADFGGVYRDVNVSLVEVKIGEYVIVHAGYAIQVMDEESAQETLNLFQEILEFEEKEYGEVKSNII